MAHGPDAVHELVEASGWSYPVSTTRLEREHALANVQIDAGGNSMLLAEALARVDADRFENRADLERALGPVFDAESRARGGFAARLRRSLFGFLDR